MMMWELKKMLYRSKQKTMKIVSIVIPFPEPELLTGPGSVKKLAQKIKEKGLKHVLVVTDKILMKLKVPAGLLE
jgi:alcohol dehydrogenase